jgi:hypothetical protein
MKIELYTKDPRLRVSPRYGGQGVLLNLVTDLPQGRPRQGRWYHRNGWTYRKLLLLIKEIKFILYNISRIIFPLSILVFIEELP